MARIIGAALLALVLAGCGTAPQDQRFIIHNYGDIAVGDVNRIRAELDAGLAALKKLPVALLEDKFPVTVYLYSRGGISNSTGGGGPINLFGVGSRNPAAVHELAHVLTGYRGIGGDAHWIGEGFATWVQDEYGARAYPTRGHAHGLARIIFERDTPLPMTDVMRDRRRRGPFGRDADAWTRWRAYAEAASFARYLIETGGLETFLKLYARRGDADQEAAIAAVYGKPANAVIADWRRFIAGYNADRAGAERAYALLTRNLR